MKHTKAGGFIQNKFHKQTLISRFSGFFLFLLVQNHSMNSVNVSHSESIHFDVIPWNLRFYPNHKSETGEQMAKQRCEQENTRT